MKQFHKKSKSKLYGVLGAWNWWKFEKASIVEKFQYFLFEKESQIQDLWNRKSTHVKLYVLDLFKQSTTCNRDCWSLIDKVITLGSMFTKIYLTIAIVLCCYKKCSNFLWYFDSNSLSSLVSLFPKQKLCVFASVVPFQLAKIANWFLFKCFV